MRRTQVRRMTGPLIYGVLALIFTAGGVFGIATSGADLLGLLGSEVKCGSTVMAAQDGCAWTQYGKTHTEQLLPDAFAADATPQVSGATVRTVTQMGSEKRSSEITGLVAGAAAITTGIGLFVLAMRIRRASQNTTGKH